MGNYSNGALFGAYCLSALFFGNMIVAVLGVKWSLVVGLFQYCLYLLMYLLATFIHDHQIGNMLVITGAAVGGIASGYLWTAQGAYFMQCSVQYAAYSGKSQEYATGVCVSPLSAAPPPLSKQKVYHCV